MLNNIINKVNIRKIAEKYRLLWFLIALIPVATIIHLIGEPMGMNSEKILCYQLPALSIQLFGCFMIFRYR